MSFFNITLNDIKSAIYLDITLGHMFCSVLFKFNITPFIEEKMEALRLFHDLLKVILLISGGVGFMINPLILTFGLSRHDLKVFLPVIGL